MDNSDPAKAYVVAIGASAGGLEAITGFFKNMPPDSGLIFVVIQHLSPDYKSMMDELLSKVTAMPVSVVTDGVEAEPDHVYLIPPCCNMTLQHGHLLLEAQNRMLHMVNLPIDLFFQSLAQECGSRSVAIVLSGTGSDGTRGCRRIKEEGGLVMVQTESSTQFGGMPKSVIANGLADFVLPVEALPKQLLQYINHSLIDGGAASNGDSNEQAKSALEKIFNMLRSCTKIDFSFYKPPTILRRIQRRMSILQVAGMEEYAEYVQLHAEELRTLYRELLIGVTSFFRDPHAFDMILDKHMKALIQESSGRQVFRFWVAGCSTGEEAYTLCMLFQEACERLNKHCELKVFATDIDQDALNKASAGIYPESIAADVPGNLLGKYFVRRDDGMQIAQQIREMVVFARHDLIKDPPFTNIDLVSCRNLLIYLQASTQKRILDGFNFSLRSGGLLMLGSSETIGDADAFFEVRDPKWKIFVSKGHRKSLLGAERFNLPKHALFIPREWASSAARRSSDVVIDDARVLELFTNQVVPEYIAFAAIVEESNEIIRVIGNSKRFLNPLAGRVSMDINKLLLKELNVPVMTGLTKAFRNQLEVSFSNVRYDNEEASGKVNILIKPLKARRNMPPLVAIAIADSEDAGTAGHQPVDGTYDVDIGVMQRIHDLEQELQFSRESLQATIEELETSNEELQATNEELLSSNEELQSTNEELQSVNEELFTVNSEYQGKISEMGELHTDLENFMAATQTIVLFLDMNACIRRFTSNARLLFNIMQHDIGRPLEHISHRLLDIDLHEEVRRVNDESCVFEDKVNTEVGDGFRMRILPYLLNNNKQSGVIIALHEDRDKTSDAE